MLHSTQSTTRCCSSDWNLALEYLGQHCAGLNHTSLVDLSASVLKAATPRSSIYPTVPLKVYASVPYFYASTLFEIVKAHLPNAHAYADDTQLYLSFKPYSHTNQTEAVGAMEACIEDIRAWMAADLMMTKPRSF